ncbi:hypothetical protein N7456_003537 [Penicillium angulare]|uniref:Uncharacterized protein n=1 Tax=Penicillium angulare TaxID=116970 RepID=A0A9W9KIU4_9EURO|nr:hypothetical protein N7456_003537 [Penicillium angulare]
MEHPSESNGATHFGFDPVSPTTHTEDRKKKQIMRSDFGAYEPRSLCHRVETKLSLDETGPHAVPNLGSHSSDIAIEYAENCTATDLWGFDPPGEANPGKFAPGKIHTDHSPETQKEVRRGKNTTSKE